MHMHVRTYNMEECAQLVYKTRNIIHVPYHTQHLEVVRLNTNWLGTIIVSQ